MSIYTIHDRDGEIVINSTQGGSIHINVFKEDIAIWNRDSKEGSGHLATILNKNEIKELARELQRILLEMT
jgi:hypothetical protein